MITAIDAAGSDRVRRDSLRLQRIAARRWLD
jgi:hypothetical protein